MHLRSCEDQWAASQRPSECIMIEGKREINDEGVLIHLNNQDFFSLTSCGMVDRGLDLESVDLI